MKFVLNAVPVRRKPPKSQNQRHMRPRHFSIQRAIVCPLAVEAEVVDHLHHQTRQILTLVETNLVSTTTTIHGRRAIRLLLGMAAGWPLPRSSFPKNFASSQWPGGFCRGAVFLKILPAASGLVASAAEQFS